jgi:hypothetical protein
MSQATQLLKDAKRYRHPRRSALAGAGGVA